MKLIVRQLSGLGNQMFQYAAGLYYAAQHKAQVHLIVDGAKNAHSYGHPRPFLLSHFAITARHRELNKLDRFFLSTERRRLKPVAGPLLQKMLRIQVVSERIDQRFRFQAELPVDNAMKTVYLLGYWQVHNIAESLSADLRREFSFRTPPAGRNLEILRLIHDMENSVSIHVRRGDYTLEAEGNVALSVDYYERAITQLRTSLRNPTFFIFSDDIKFAKENLPKQISAVFIDHNDSMSAHEDLRLMSACNHQIIANSTFSWWGAWLNSRPDKIVVAPRHWRVANCPSTNDLIPISWRLVD